MTILFSKRETVFLSTKDKDYIVNSFNNFRDYFAIRALLHVYKHFNKEFSTSDDALTSIDALFLVSNKAVKRIQEEGVIRRGKDGFIDDVIK